jgi:hypothetical protein
MVYLVLIGKPQSLNIPYFAMPSSSSRETCWFYPNKKSKPLSEILGGNAYRWIVEKKKNHDIRRICTRNYIPIKTAFYANWLVFKENTDALGFMDKFPQYRTNKFLEKIENDLTDLTKQVDEKIIRKAYDISCYPVEQRRAAAFRYIKFDDQIRELKENIEFLHIAERFRVEWTRTLANELD